METEVCLLQNDTFNLPIKQHICFLMANIVKSLSTETGSQLLPSATHSQSKKGNKNSPNREKYNSKNHNPMITKSH